MTSHTVQLIDRARKVIATATVIAGKDCFTGQVDLRPMPAALRPKFEEYEGVVNGQMFSLLDAIEDEIGALGIRAVFGEGREAPVEDLQIYPSTGLVSFRLAQPAVVEATARDGTAG
jgi:hypothetical protein